MAISLSDSRQLSDEILQALRIRALHARELGYSEAAIADVLGVARETISRWWSAYISKGIDSIPGDRTGHPMGIGRKLTDPQGDHLQNLIDHHHPRQLGIASPVWNRRAVQDLIRKEFGVRIAIRTVGEYLKRWGYTTKKPSRHSRHQDPQEVKKWLEQTFPDLTEKANAEGAEVFWLDETSVAADQFPGYGYARKGEAATMEVPASHIRVNLISGISNQGTIRFMTFPRGMTAELFIEFLRRLNRGAKHKIYVIADRLKAHQAKEVQKWLDEHKSQIEIQWLPKNSPELNPDEYFNNDLKAKVNTQGLPDTQEQLRWSMGSFLRKLLHNPGHVMSYFQNRYVAYAAVGACM